MINVKKWEKEHLHQGMHENMCEPSRWGGEGMEIIVKTVVSSGAPTILCRDVLLTMSRDSRRDASFRKF